MTGAACRAGNAYPSVAPDFTSGFHRGSCCPVICVSLFHVIVLDFGFWVLIVPFFWLLGIYIFYFAWFTYAYCVYMSQMIQYSRTCNSYQDFLHRSVLWTWKLLSQGFIETTFRSTLKKFFGRYHHLTLPYLVPVTTMANNICRPWYCCHEYVSYLDTT